jgi:starvation-inducible DNA-binding protein
MGHNPIEGRNTPNGSHGRTNGHAHGKLDQLNAINRQEETVPSRNKAQSSKAQNNGKRRAPSPEPTFARTGVEIQRFGALRLLPIGLSSDARMESCQILNEILADTMILYSLYKKHHWLVAGPTFYQLHLLFDKHAQEQLELVDLLAERVQSLGGIAVGDPRHAAELTSIDRPPNGAEDVPEMIHRLLDAHETIIDKVRDGIDKTEKSEDWGSNDILMSDVLRRHELQVWFVAEHVVDVPLIES